MALPRSCTPLILALAACAGGCAYSVDAERADPPPAPVRTVVVGRMAMDNTDRERDVRLFRRDLIAALQESKAFDRILGVAPTPLPVDALVVTGRFRKISDGDEALRFLVGYGVGAPQMRADFVLADAAGQPLAAFSEHRRDYGGTSWSGHFAATDIDDLATDFAARTAALIIRWSRGEPIAPEPWDYVGL